MLPSLPAKCVLSVYKRFRLENLVFLHWVQFRSWNHFKGGKKGASHKITCQVWVYTLGASLLQEITSPVGDLRL